MLICNGLIYWPDKTFRPGTLSVHGEKITAISSSEIQHQESDEEIIDASGKYVVPGLIDIHAHGFVGCDFSDGDAASIKTISRYLSLHGITSFAASIMSMPVAHMAACCAIIAGFCQNGSEGAYCHGLHLEGPFLSPAKCGAQASENLISPSNHTFDQLRLAGNGFLRMLTVAPELSDAIDFIQHASAYCTVALGHTQTDYASAVKAIRAGAKHITHLYHAMPPLHHRAPGLIGAAIDTEVTIELICDGYHVHPAAIRAAYRLFGAERTVLISDSMSACGMPDGRYSLGGQEVQVHARKATLRNGTLAGTACDLMDDLRNAVDCGIRLEDALQSATINPAKVIGCDHQTGSLEVGKNADIVLLDQKLSVRDVWIKGVHMEQCRP